MIFLGKCKIGKIVDGERKHVTNCNDLRVEYRNGKWVVGGFCDNPDGQNIKTSSFVQSGDHYGKKGGSVVGCIIIDTPEFFGIKKDETTESILVNLREGVPLNAKWGLPYDHFGKHYPITFEFCGQDRYGLGECFLYDIKFIRWSW